MAGSRPGGALKLDPSFRQAAWRQQPPFTHARDVSGMSLDPHHRPMTPLRRRRDGGGELSEDERAELARLSKENAALTMRCGVLKRTQGCGATTCCPPRRGAR